jgi:adenosine kinase
MGIDFSKPSVVICGSIAIDRIMSFTGHYRELINPEKLHVLSLSMLLDNLKDSPGGIGANVAYSLAQLGEKPVLVGSVGHDAEAYIKSLDELGIDTSHVHFSELATASFNVFTDSDDNQVGGFFQGAMSDSETVSFAPWQGQNILAVICANNPEAMNRQVEECKQMNMRMVFDPGQQVTDNVVDMAKGIANAEVVLVNEYELGILSLKTNQTPEELKKHIPVLITTFGKDGSIIEGSKLSEPLHIGVAKTDPIDPTGAGDAYRAGFLYGYLRQWDLLKCGQLGATVASFIIEKHGTQQPFTRQSIIERYKQNFKEEIKL